MCASRTCYPCLKKHGFIIYSPTCQMTFGYLQFFSVTRGQMTNDVNAAEIINQ